MHESILNSHEKKIATNNTNLWWIAMGHRWWWTVFFLSLHEITQKIMTIFRQSEILTFKTKNNNQMKKKKTRKLLWCLFLSHTHTVLHRNKWKTLCYLTQGPWLNWNWSNHIEKGRALFFIYANSELMQTQLSFTNKRKYYCKMKINEN